MKLVIISDTHNFHNKITIPSGDVIIHAGDATGRGQEREIKEFIEWYSNLDFQHKIFVPGNHEVALEHNYKEWSRWFTDAGITILNDESVIVDGLSNHDWEKYKFKIYGSPITPNFGRWAYMKARGHDINQHWMKIPEDIDILVTHGPPYGILDAVNTFGGYVDHCGCEMLLARVAAIKPKLHVFGHIHEGAGSLKQDGIEYINASQLDGQYRLAHKPIVRYL